MPSEKLAPAIEEFVLEACQQGGFDSLDEARAFVRAVAEAAAREATQLLAHALYRNHDPSGGCSACSEAKALVAAIRGGADAE